MSHHLLSIIGACLALAGTLALGIELLKTKGDEAGQAEYRADQDKIESIVRETVINLNDALSDQAGFVAGYLKILEQDLKPLFKPLLEDSGDEALQARLSLGIMGRHQTIEEFDQARQQLALSGDPERAISLVREIQRRTERRFM